MSLGIRLSHEKRPETSLLEMVVARDIFIAHRHERRAIGQRPAFVLPLLVKPQPTLKQVAFTPSLPDVSVEVVIEVRRQIGGQIVRRADVSRVTVGKRGRLTHRVPHNQLNFRSVRQFHAGR
jgi:hypothetical protein